MNRTPEIAALSRWLENELDVVETYKVALERLHGTAEIASAREVMERHARHAVELRELLSALGRSALASGVHAHACTKERLAIVRLHDEDEVLSALLTNEEHRLHAYEAVLRKSGVAPLIAQLVERCIRAERRNVERLAERCDKSLSRAA